MKSCSFIPICFGLHYKIHYQATYLEEVFLESGILIVTAYLLVSLEFNEKGRDFKPE
jgi:hypothetical protein